MQALAHACRKTEADDDLGASAADIHDETTLGPGRQVMGNAEIDETRFFAARDDLDRVAERRLGTGKKVAVGRELTQGIGADCPHAAGREVAKPLTETLQAGQGAIDDLRVEPLVLAQAFAEPDHLLESIGDLHVTVADAGHDHVKAVGSEIDGCDDLWQHGLDGGLDGLFNHGRVQR